MAESFTATRSLNPSDWWPCFGNNKNISLVSQYRPCSTVILIWKRWLETSSFIFTIAPPILEDNDHSSVQGKYVNCHVTLTIHGHISLGDTFSIISNNNSFRFDPNIWSMMTSSNGNIFRATGPLWGNSPVPVNAPHKGQWRGALMFYLIYAWINDWINNREAGDLRRQRGHYDVIVMSTQSHFWLRWWLRKGINTLRPRQNGRHFADDTFKRIFLNENVRISIKISLTFVPRGPINNIP